MILQKLASLVFVVVGLTSPAGVSAQKAPIPLTLPTYATAFNELWELFRDNRGLGEVDFAALSVRLAFHDVASFNATGQGEGGGHAVLRHRCAPNGPCEHEMHDNAGLTQIINVLAPIQAKYASELSVADFWALASVTAIEYARFGTQFRFGNPASTTVQFRYGREDWPVEMSILTGRPNAELGLAHMKGIFGDRLGFSDEETVALMGAHTLGRAHAENNGYDGAWIGNTRQFDNEYFRVLTNNNRWNKRARTDPVTGQRVTQWVQNNRNFLNVDVCLVIPVEGLGVGDNFRLNNNQRRSDTFPIAQAYAADNDLFISRFGSAFGRLIELGAECLDLPGQRTCNPATPSPAPAPVNGFDWGSGCPAGGGSFQLDLPVLEAYAEVGEIPAGKFDIRVELDSTSDIDITLFDVENTRNHPEGEAIVAWCAGAGCNGGVLGFLPGEEEATYTSGATSMNIKYSGYNGVDGQKGREFIEIAGETSVRMVMKAFAYNTGSATVTYSWGRSQTPCCLGTERCTGSFTQNIVQNALVTVGEIPVGKLDIEINLISPTDVDIQVYDTDDVSSFPEGKAIVAWCPAVDCNKGVLAGSTEETAMYPTNNADGRLITYSGYNGIPEATRGTEFIRIQGESTRNMRMQAFGFRSGSAVVEYSWMESR